MKITLTPAARAYLMEQQAAAITIASLVFSSCCSGPLPPEVKAGAPQDPDGFAELQTDEITIYFDSLLDPRPELVIDLKEFPMYRELFLQGWD